MKGMLLGLLVSSISISLGLNTYANTMCTMDYNPVCGIDGRTYGNACGAGNVQIAYKGECKIPINTISSSINDRIRNSVTNLSIKIQNNYNKDQQLQVFDRILTLLSSRRDNLNRTNHPIQHAIYTKYMYEIQKIINK